MSEQCSILVLSCDKNIGLLNIFLDFFNEHWKQCPFQLYLGMESKKVYYPNVKVLTSCAPKWSGRIHEYLKTINTEYVLLILDDFILEKDVNEAEINRMLSLIRNDPHIANIAMADIFDKNNYVSEFEHLVYRTSKADFLLNLQVGLWKKSILLELLREDESPWQTELYGSIRARKFSKYKFICLDSDNNMPYVYNRGWLVVRGSWNGNEIKRLNLERYVSDIFDGKDIIYSNFMAISFCQRVKRRFGIMVRQLLSWVRIYI